MKQDNVYNLTNPQKNIISLEETSSKDSKLTTIFAFFKMVGSLDIKILKEAINCVIRKNDVLRINIINEGNKKKQVVKDYSYYDVRVIDLKDKTQEEVTQYIEKNMKNPISTNSKELFEFAILQCETHTFVVVNGSHVIYDAWSMIKVADQIKEIYGMIKNNQDIETINKNSYLEFIERENEYRNSEKYEKDKEFWNNFVENIQDVKLFENSDVFNKSAKRIKKVIDDKLFNSISTYCKQNSISEYAFLLGIISTYYSKIFNISNLTIGTPFLNRQKKYGELETIGMFISTLPLNIQVSKESRFIELCKDIWSNNLTCYKHSKFSYLDIKELYNKKKNNANLYELTFSYQISKLTNNLDGDIGVCDWLFSDEQNNELTISFVDFDNKKLLYYDFLLSCMKDKDIDLLHERIITMINQVINVEEITIKDISILSDTDIKKLKEFNNTGEIKKLDKTIIDILNETVQKYNDRIAIKYNDTEITYGELNKKVCILAHRLRELGVSKNTPVVLLQDKNIDTIISIFAVLKAGGCYVPILPEESTNRIEYIINDCNPVCILTNNMYSQKMSFGVICLKVEEELNSENILPLDFNNSNCDDLAYIIYTSGSTGNPKGTMIMHKNIVGLIKSMEVDEILKPTDIDISMSLLKYSFDASGVDIYSALLCGGKLVIIPKEYELNPIEVLKVIEKEKVTRSFLIPKWIERIAITDEKENYNLSSLKILGTGGETLKPKILKNFLNKYKNLKLLNLYGPTETTMFVTYKIVKENNIDTNYVEIGKPIPYSRVAILDADNNMLPIETKGELAVYEDKDSIENICKGYLNLNLLNEEKFIETYNPINKERIKAYKTGDVAKINKNGEIDFISRFDDMVKVNRRLFSIY